MEEIGNFLAGGFTTLISGLSSLLPDASDFVGRVESASSGIQSVIPLAEINYFFPVSILLELTLSFGLIVIAYNVYLFVIGWLKNIV